MRLLTRYWIIFDVPRDSHFSHLKMGCGITAFDYSDALSIARKNIFIDIEMPSIILYTENIDMNTLDQNHIIPNMLPSNCRGVWFPNGFQNFYSN